MENERSTGRNWLRGAVRGAAAMIWVILLVGLGAGLVDPPSATAYFGGCNDGGFGCASNYGVLEGGSCASLGPHCSSCLPEPISFCAPEVGCEVENCKLDNHRTRLQ